MNATELRIPLPVGVSAEEARELLAVRLFELGRISRAAAAELAGLPIPGFSAALIRASVPVIQSDASARVTELAKQGIVLTPGRPDPNRWAEPLPNLPGVDLSGAVLEEREEALRRWD